MKRGTTQTPFRGPSIRVERIMVPVDFSPASRMALRWGIILARAFDASLIVAHVVEAGSALDRVLGSLSLMAGANRRRKLPGCCPPCFRAASNRIEAAFPRGNRRCSGSTAGGVPSREG
jgi:hypothetical protein